MEDINQYGNSEIAGNSASRIKDNLYDQGYLKLKQLGKKRKSNLYCESFFEAFLLYLLINNYHLIKNKTR